MLVLSTLNSRYPHCSFGLRYLYANLNELQSVSELKEFTIQQSPEDIVEYLLSKNPKIIGFGVYIWNTIQTLDVIRILKAVKPEIKIILGGPEVSYEQEDQEICSLADHIIVGEAEVLFYELCSDLLNSTKQIQKKITGSLPDLKKLKPPYSYYDEHDIAHRVIYVEASRGCPYKCEYCLSSLDKEVREFDLDQFFLEITNLLGRGARSFKFVDRTFNLKISTSTKILEFFLQWMDQNKETLFLHFELVPDRLPLELKTLIEKYPLGSLQFEIGIQTINSEVSALISRKQNLEKTFENLKYLKEKTGVHTHVDLIAGLPHESIKSFMSGLNTVWELNPGEIQLGILKRLRGAPISRHTKTFDMVYDSRSPYSILCNSLLSYGDVQFLKRYSKYWDLVVNSGHFKVWVFSLDKIRLDSNLKFSDIFKNLTDFLWSKHKQLHSIALQNLTQSLHEFSLKYFLDHFNVLQNALVEDYCIRGKRDKPKFFGDAKVIRQLEKTTILSNHQTHQDRQLRHLN